MFRRRQLRCSFCYKSERQVSKLVAGPRVYICDGCVRLASRIIEGGSPDDQPPGVESSAWDRLRDRAHKLWRGGDAGRVNSRELSA